MKQNLIFLTLLLVTTISYAQTYDSLQKLNLVSQNVYFSVNAKERAIKVAANVAKAETYFQKEFNVTPSYTLLVLSPSDWKKYAHPNAIYGIPHYLPDGRLLVASENNDFWRRNTPSVDKIPSELAQKLKNTYANQNGEIELTNFFDLLAIHELGHAFRKAAGVTNQRNWLSELHCNVLLHTFVAENSPELLLSLTTFPEITVAAFPSERLKYTKLEDFETYYNDLAQNHPDNYGWYQCRFHVVAREIYDSGGVIAMKKMWHTLLAQKEKLNDKDLMDLLKKTHPSLEKAINNWDK